MIEITEVQGFPLSICGDFHEVLLFTEGNSREEANSLIQAVEEITGPGEFSNFSASGGKGLINIKIGRPLTREEEKEVRALRGASRVFLLAPILPALSRKDRSVPFPTAEEMIAFSLRYAGARRNAVPPPPW